MKYILEQNLNYREKPSIWKLAQWNSMIQNDSFFKSSR